MGSRKHIGDSTQSQILVQSRRRCCICFGLKRDDEVKKGQIAHLDHDASNNSPDNLAYLCFDHHDEYDSTTRQSKGLKREEVEQYKKELINHFDGWMSYFSRENIINFLSFSIDLDMMTDAAIRVGGSVVFYGPEHAFDVLTTDQVDYCDADLYIPHLMALDHFAAWGWLNFSYEEKEEVDDMPRTHITVERKPICDEVAKQILKRLKEQGKETVYILNCARNRGWKLLENDASIINS